MKNVKAEENKIIYTEEAAKLSDGVKEESIMERANFLCECPMTTAWLILPRNCSANLDLVALE